MIDEEKAKLKPIDIGKFNITENGNVIRKTEKKYRPYKDTEEMLDDFCERFKAKRTCFTEPPIWVKSKTGIKYLINEITESHVWIASAVIGMNDLFKLFTYKNDSPCGKEIKE